jgi:hypothetical protein
MRIRHGVDADLETQADELIKQSFIDRPDRDAKALILTVWMETSRRRREVYVTDGVPDGSIRRGSFNRVINPIHTHLNAVEGTASRPRRRPSLGESSDE